MESVRQGSLAGLGMPRTSRFRWLLGVSVQRNGARWSRLVRALLLAAASAVPNSVAGQSRVLRVVVKDAATGAPIEGAAVRVLDDSLTPIQFSAPSGRVAVKVRPGSTRVAVARIGFAPDTVELVLGFRRFGWRRRRSGSIRSSLPRCGRHPTGSIG